MPQKAKREGKQKKQPKKSGKSESPIHKIKLDVALETILSDKLTNPSLNTPLKAEDERVLAKKESLALTKKQDSPKKASQTDKSQLEKKINVKELQILEEPDPSLDVPISAEPATPLMREIPSQTRINYDSNPEAAAAAQEEDRQRRYRERIQPAPQPIAPAQTPAPEERGSYSARALYTPQRTNKEQVYSLQEKSMQMSNILKDRTSPVRPMQQTPFIQERQREIKTNPIHEEYTLDLEHQEKPKPKRRYPWEA